MIFRAFGLAVAQLSDGRFRRVFLIGIALALLLLVGATAGFAWFIEWITPEEAWLPVLGEVRWLNDLLSWGAAFLLAFLSIFLMVPVASAITSMFLDDVADAVEATHYPTLPPTTRVPFWDAVRDTVNFLGVLVGANILALLLYIPFAPFAPIIFWALNGFLLGREYFTLAAIRRVGRKGAKQLRRRHFATIWAAGILMAVPLSVPLINLLVPILGAATFTHLYHLLAPARD
nr:EI24 domain-containing protein [Sulfitobacter aestuariivivens]